MADQGYAQEVGQAWNQYRNGLNDAAVSGFQDVISRDSTNIDAHYGLGLVRRAQHDYEAAISAFLTCKELVAVAVANEPGADRWEILERMVEQRLNELKKVTR